MSDAGGNFVVGEDWGRTLGPAEVDEGETEGDRVGGSTKGSAIFRLGCGGSDDWDDGGVVEDGTIDLSGVEIAAVRNVTSDRARIG